MKRFQFTLLIITLLWAWTGIEKGYAQEDPQYTQYMFNKLVYNPGVAGTRTEDGIDYADLTVLLRNQWLGFSDGTPQTQNFAAHLPVLLFTNSKIGMGLHVNHDRIGVDRNTDFMLSASYIYQGFSFGNISIGASGGLSQSVVDGSLFLPPDGIGSPDPNIPDIQVSASTADFNLGLYIYEPEKYWVGISTTHLAQPTLTFTDANATVDIQQIRHLYAIAGYTIGIGNTPFDVTPSAKFKTDGIKTQLDIDALVTYNKNLWAGIGLRGVTADQRDAIMALVGFNLTRHLRMGYSFDATTSRIRSFSAGTHEFMVNYRISVIKPPPPSRPIHCPRFL